MQAQAQSLSGDVGDLQSLAALFSVPLSGAEPSLADQLDQASSSDDKSIPPSLRNAFRENYIPLSANAQVAAEVAGDKWKIADGDGNRSYAVWKNGERVDVLDLSSVALRVDDIIGGFSVPANGQLGSLLSRPGSGREPEKKAPVPEQWRTLFEGKALPLSPQATLAVQEPGSRWKITDPVRGLSYSIEKQGQIFDVFVHLKVYDEMESQVGIILENTHVDVDTGRLDKEVKGLTDNIAQAQTSINQLNAKIQEFKAALAELEAAFGDSGKTPPQTQGH